MRIDAFFSAGHNDRFVRIGWIEQRPLRARFAVRGARIGESGLEVTWSSSVRRRMCFTSSGRVAFRLRRQLNEPRDWHPWSVALTPRLLEPALSVQWSAHGLSAAFSSIWDHYVALCLLVSITNVGRGKLELLLLCLMEFRLFCQASAVLFLHLFAPVERCLRCTCLVQTT